MEMSKVALVIWLVCIGLTHELAIWALRPFLIILVPKLFLQTQPLALVKGMGVLFCFLNLQPAAKMLEEAPLLVSDPWIPSEADFSDLGLGVSTYSLSHLLIEPVLLEVP